MYHGPEAEAGETGFAATTETKEGHKEHKTTINEIIIE